MTEDSYSSLPRKRYLKKLLAGAVIISFVCFFVACQQGMLYPTFGNLPTNIGTSVTLAESEQATVQRSSEVAGYSYTQKGSTCEVQAGGRLTIVGVVDDTLVLRYTISIDTPLPDEEESGNEYYRGYQPCAPGTIITRSTEQFHILNEDHIAQLRRNKLLLEKKKKQRQLDNVIEDVN